MSEVATRSRVQYDQTTQSVPVNSERHASLFCLDSYLCQCVCQKEERQKGFVSVQKLSMIHVSPALICELCAAPG